MKFNVKLTLIFLVLTFLFSCKTERKEIETGNTLKVLLPPQDSTIQFDHFIYIDTTETFYLDEVKISITDLTEKLKESKKAKSSLIVQLEMEENVKIEKMVTVMNICKKENIELKLKTK